MGLSLEALIAGAIPNITPMATEKPKAKITDHGVTVDTKRMAMIIDTPIPKIIPTTPPVTESITASIKNCFKMSFLFAPSAFLSPISLVLSVTDTSMILATPIPPTQSEIAAIPPSANENMPVILEIVEDSESAAPMEKSSVVSLFKRVLFICLIIIGIRSGY